MLATSKLKKNHGGASALRRNNKRPHANGNLPFHHGQHVAGIFAGMDHTPDFGLAATSACAILFLLMSHVKT